MEFLILLENKIHKRDGCDSMIVVKNVIPEKYKSDEERKKELKRIYVSIQRTMYVNGIYGKKKHKGVC